MKRHSKLVQQQRQHEEQAASQQHQTTSEGVHEFANAEDMLRYDADQTSVPPGVARKLQESLGRADVQRTPWWRKLFGG